jgi:hypothetical protein
MKIKTNHVVNIEVFDPVYYALCNAVYYAVYYQWAMQSTMQ